jgi:hypothetical protein
VRVVALLSQELATTDGQLQSARRHDQAAAFELGKDIVRMTLKIAETSAGRCRRANTGAIRRSIFGDAGRPVGGAHFRYGHRVPLPRDCEELLGVNAGALLLHGTRRLPSEHVCSWRSM